MIIVLIIVVWLFVLAPLLLRGQKPIRKAGEAFDDTRVIHQGGSGDLSARRRPRLAATDVRPAPADEEDETLDYELVDADEVLLDDDLPTRSSKGLFTRTGEPAEIVDGGVVHELAPIAQVTEIEEQKAVAAAEESGTTVTADWDEWDEEETTYAYDDSYTSPSDFLYPDSAEAGETTAEDVEDEVEKDEQLSADLSDDELSEDEIEFAEHRAARGGWDPVADAEYSLTRYQRRQRTLIGLAAAVVITAIIAFVIGSWSWSWLLPALAVVVTAVYLTALRSQVREEQALRMRRIRQLRRARLGVRSANDDELDLPRRLRRPGAVVLERDDESPDFEHLPVADTRVAQLPDRQRHHDDRYSRRVG
nr:gephyrin-like molybdotransferase receptor GlpR [Corynebacterium lemuris]